MGCRSKGWKEGRTLKMHDATLGGLSRPSDNIWAKVARERTLAISGLATRKLFATVRRAF